MLISYGIAFCRWTIGLVFVLSCTAKLRDVTTFTDTIRRFKLLPDQLVRLAAWVILSSESVILVTMLIGSRLLAWGFLLAGALLLIFCLALLSVLLRRIQTPCNCFGAFSKTPVSSLEIIRSLIFSLCAISGYGLFQMAQGNPETLGLLEWILSGISAMVFVLTMVRLKEIVWVFRIA